MTPAEISSLMSHLWHSLDPASKARYTSEELRLKSLFHAQENQDVATTPTEHPRTRMVFKSPAELLGLQHIPGLINLT
jgi:hypothetical protein